MATQPAEEEDTGPALVWAGGRGTRLGGGSAEEGEEGEEGEEAEEGMNEREEGERGGGEGKVRQDMKKEKR